MRHRRKVHQLALPADQRKAMLRSLATSLFIHGQITTTLHRAKALKEQADRIVTLSKSGNLHSMRQILKLIHNQPTGHIVTLRDKLVPETALRRIVAIGQRYTERKGGYTRIIQAPPRRGDAAPMAVIELVD